MSNMPTPSPGTIRRQACSETRKGEESASQEEVVPLVGGVRPGTGGRSSLMFGLLDHLNDSQVAVDDDVVSRFDDLGRVLVKVSDRRDMHHHRREDSQIIALS